MFDFAQASGHLALNLRSLQPPSRSGNTHNRSGRHPQSFSGGIKRCCFMPLKWFFQFFLLIWKPERDLGALHNVFRGSMGGRGNATCFGCTLGMHRGALNVSQGVLITFLRDPHSVFLGIRATFFRWSCNVLHESSRNVFTGGHNKLSWMQWISGWWSSRDLWVPTMRFLKIDQGGSHCNWNAENFFLGGNGSGRAYWALFFARQWGEGTYNTLEVPMSSGISSCSPCAKNCSFFDVCWSTITIGATSFHLKRAFQLLTKKFVYIYWQWVHTSHVFPSERLVSSTVSQKFP